MNREEAEDLLSTMRIPLLQAYGNALVAMGFAEAFEDEPTKWATVKAALAPLLTAEEREGVEHNTALGIYGVIILGYAIIKKISFKGNIVMTAQVLNNTFDNDELEAITQEISRIQIENQKVSPA